MCIRDRLRIESKNVFSAPEYDVTFQSIPGRNGDLILPNGRYPNVQVTYSELCIRDRYKEAIMEAMYKGTKRNIESETDSKNAQVG